MTRKQSAQDRQERLDRGACPIHGHQMGARPCEWSGWLVEQNPELRQQYGTQYEIVGCDHADCPVQGKFYQSRSERTGDSLAFYVNTILLPEWQHLLEGEQEGELTPRAVSPAEPEPIPSEYPGYVPLPCPSCGWFSLEWATPPEVECNHCDKRATAHMKRTLRRVESDDER